MGRESTTSQPTTKQLGSRVIVPAIDEFVMQVMGMSIALKTSGIVGRSAYDTYKPDGWPTLRCVLDHYGIAPTSPGWKQFIDIHIGEFEHVVIKARWCKVCTRPQIHKTGRCYTCYWFWSNNGYDRPRHLWDVDAKCSNCNFPLAAAGRRPTFKDGSMRRRQCNGRCQACDSYWRKYKRERPRHLWGDGAYGWCSCGHPANYQKDGFDLCSRCAEV